MEETAQFSSRLYQTIKTDHKETVYDAVDRIELAQNRVQWLVLVNNPIPLRTIKIGDFLVINHKCNRNTDRVQ